MSALFQPFTLRGLTLPNRIVISPLCEYSAEDGCATDWHVIHLVTKYRDNLKSLRGIYIDCGWRDQYHIHYGARILSKRTIGNSILLFSRVWPMTKVWR